MLPNETVELCKKIAYKAHKGQTRHDGKTPYITHVERVVELVGDDKKLQCLAWLHDVIEDTIKYTESTLIKLGVPVCIVCGVDTLTHRKNYSYDTYINNIKLQGEESVNRVKIADIVANLSDSPTKEQIRKYYQALYTLCE